MKILSKNCRHAVNKIKIKTFPCFHFLFHFNFSELIVYFNNRVWTRKWCHTKKLKNVPPVGIQFFRMICINKKFGNKVIDVVARKVWVKCCNEEKLKSLGWSTRNEFAEGTLHAEYKCLRVSGKCLSSGSLFASMENNQRGFRSSISAFPVC